MFKYREIKIYNCFVCAIDIRSCYLCKYLIPIFFYIFSWWSPQHSSKSVGSPSSHQRHVKAMFIYAFGNQQTSNWTAFLYTQGWVYKRTIRLVSGSRSRWSSAIPGCTRFADPSVDLSQLLGRRPAGARTITQVWSTF